MIENITHQMEDHCKNFTLIDTHLHFRRELNNCKNDYSLNKYQIPLSSSVEHMNTIDKYMVRKHEFDTKTITCILGSEMPHNKLALHITEMM